MGNKISDATTDIGVRGSNKQFTPPNFLDRLQEFYPEVSWRRLQTDQIVGFPSERLFASWGICTVSSIGRASDS